MRCCGRHFRLLCVSLLLTALPAWADEIAILESRLQATEKECLLSATFSIPFNTQLEDVVKKGVVLHFVLDFKLERPRWYAWNKEMIRKSETIQLSYHILTRQFQLSTDITQQRFASLDEALQSISRVYDWPIRCREELELKRTYEAVLQMRLDLSSMPRPVQIDAFSNESWSLSSEWKRWKFTLPELPAEPPAEPEAANRPDAGAEAPPPAPPPEVGQGLSK